MRKILKTLLIVLILISCETDLTSTIIDENIDVIYFEEDTFENLENNTEPLSFVLNSIKSGNSTQLTLGGDAVRNQDYIISNEDINLAFEQGIYTKSIEIIFIDNEITDGDKNIILSLPEGQGFGPNNQRELTITIIDDDAPSGTIVVKIDGETEDEQDDVEEAITGSQPGRIDDGSSDLEFGEIEGGSQGVQMIGLRFNNLLIPKGAIIESAYIQFQVDETVNNPATVVYEIYAEATDNALQFDDVDFSVSSRPTTSQKVDWDIPVWSSVGDRGSNQRTVDISAIVKEVVDRDGWQPLNSMAFIFKPTAATLLNPESSGRVAEDGDDPDQAAVLTVNWIRS